MSGDGSTVPAPPPPHSPRARRWPDLLWLAVLVAWTAGWCLSAAPRLGLTYDEPFYLDAGLDAWRGWSREDGKRRGFDHYATAVTGVMPLPIDAFTLPLYVHERRTGTKLETPQAKHELLRSARAVTLLWLWLLVFSAWRLGRAAGGPWAGRLAAGLLAADPNFLGHASVAATDIAASAALIAFARALYCGRGGRWWKRWLLPGLWFGVAALCKISLLLYGGLVLVTFEVCYQFASGGLSRPEGAALNRWAWKVVGTVLRSVLNAVFILTLGIGIAILYFGFPNEDQHPFVSVARTVPPTEPLSAKYLEWAENSEGTPNAVCAFAFQWWYNARGRPSYLNGTFYPESYRYYFPTVVLMKVPLPVFALALLALPRPRALANPFALAALLTLASLLTANLQIGVRLAFPALALAYVAVAVALARGYPRCALWVGVPAVLTVAVTSAWVWPHGLGYLNQAHGGPAAAHWRVSDSNVDWGQGLPDLKRWHAANGEPPVSVWYFGTDPAVNRDPFCAFVAEHAVDKHGARFELTDPSQVPRAVGPRVLAVGHTVRTMHPAATPAKAAALEYLKTCRPMACTATFTLYDFRDGANGFPLRE
ncbi:MAG: hypothetical protein ACKODX_04135 [Gemmata sp.]